MRITDMNWMQVEAQVQRDDRTLIPLGSTEQHAYLSLSTDSILAERVALEAAFPLGVPVYPVLHYGCAPYFLDYPGTISIRYTTYLNIVRDLLDSVAATGFRRIVIVNGHGGNSSAANFVIEWMAEHPDVQVKWHDWWRGPRTWAQVQAIDPAASHASWMENFPWTRLPGITMPAEQKHLPERGTFANLAGKAAREYYGDGNFDGYYQRSDEEMNMIWLAAVKETRSLLENDWR